MTKGQLIEFLKPFHIDTKFKINNTDMDILDVSYKMNKDRTGYVNFDSKEKNNDTKSNKRNK